MWYVIQVRAGSEERVRAMCGKIITDGSLERCFIPYYKERKHFRGEWTERERVLFPGYVFLVTGEVGRVAMSLHGVPGMTRLLGTGDEIVPLTEAEVALLKRLGGGGQVVEVSAGIIVGSEVKVTDGPLAGMEGLIRKVDRHKRKAWLELEMFGRAQKVEVGLEIVSKTG